VTAARRRAGEGRGRAGYDPPAADDGDVLAPPHPDWLYHHLSVTGDADLVIPARFAADSDVS